MRSGADAVGDRLARLLSAWRCDIRSVPMPNLIDAASAAEVVRYAAWAGRVRASPDETRTRFLEH
jgi:hypothetical protein